MEVEDDDVMFENSVLHQVLKESGCQDIETVPRYQKEGCHSQETSGPATIPKRNPHILDYMYDGKSWCGSCLPKWTLNLFMHPSALDDLYKSKEKETLRRLMSSKLLTEDDRSFLSNVFEGEPGLTHTSNWGWHLDLLRFLPIILVLSNVAVMCCVYLPSSLSLIVACLHLPVIGGSLTWVLVVWVLLLASLLLLVCCAVNIGIKTQISARFSAKEEQLKEFERNALDLIKVEKKCLRFIQESEMVARGFTITSQRHLISRFESSSKNIVDQLCPELRDLVVVGNHGVFSGIGNVVENIIQTIPGTSPMSKFNPLGGLADLCGTKKGLVNDLQWIPSPEDLTPGAIKASVDLLALFFSGLMCRIVLCYHQNNGEDNYNPYAVTVEPVTSLSPVVVSLHSTLSSCYSLLRAVHSPSNNSNQQVQEIGQRKNEIGQLENLYTCVHSLDLHLQSVLHLTRQMTVNLEGKLESCKCEMDGSSVGVDTLVTSREEQQCFEDSLKQIKCGLDSCLDCHQESLKKLLAVRDHSADLLQNAKLAPTSKVFHPDPTEASSAPRLHIPDEDPVIEDEVFEGITDEDGERDQSKQVRFTEEDRVKMKMFREMAKSLRKELEAVVSEKAKEQQIREERALARVRARGNAQTVDVPRSNQEHMAHRVSDHSSDKKEVIGQPVIGQTSKSNRPTPTGEVEEGEEPISSSQKLSNEDRMMDSLSSPGDRYNCDGDVITQSSESQGHVANGYLCNEVDNDIDVKIMDSSSDSCECYSVSDPQCDNCLDKPTSVDASLDNSHSGPNSSSSLTKFLDDASPHFVEDGVNHDCSDCSYVDCNVCSLDNQESMAIKTYDKNTEGIDFEGSGDCSFSNISPSVKNVAKHPVPKHRRSKEAEMPYATTSEERMCPSSSDGSVVSSHADPATECVETQKCDEKQLNHNAMSITLNHNENCLSKTGQDRRPCHNYQDTSYEKCLSKTEQDRRTCHNYQDTSRELLCSSLSMNFSSNIATMAAHKARLFQSSETEETFGDTSSDEDLR